MTDAELKEFIESPVFAASFYAAMFAVIAVLALLDYRGAAALMFSVTALTGLIHIFSKKK